VFEPEAYNDPLEAWGSFIPEHYEEIRKLTTISFADLKLAPEILKALTESGYTNPTPVQA